MTYPNAALTDACLLLMDDYGLSPEQIANLATDLPRECAAMADNRAEASYLDHQQSLMESGGRDDSAYRRDMIATGRGHLLGGSS